VQQRKKTVKHIFNFKKNNQVQSNSAKGDITFLSYLPGGTTRSEVGRVGYKQREWV